MIHIWSLFGPLEGADNTALTFLVAVLTPPPQHVCPLHSDDVSVATIVPRAPWQKVQRRVLQVGPHLLEI